MTAIDYAWGAPPVSVLKQYGVTAVGRYVGPQAWGKTDTPRELLSLAAAGIGTWLVFEEVANDSTGGYAAGRANAQLALASAPHPSFGTSRPLYFAVDAAINPQTAVPYFQGVNSVIDPAWVGDYGEGDLNQLLHDLGLSTWHWLSGSTSYPGSSGPRPITNIWQRVGNPIPGYSTDPDDLLTVDVGQYPAPFPVPDPIPTTNRSLLLLVGG